MDQNGFAILLPLALGIVLGLIVGIVIGKRMKKIPPFEYIACPNCTQPVRPHAKVCHHCHQSTGFNLQPISNAAGAP